MKLFRGWWLVILLLMVNSFLLGAAQSDNELQARKDPGRALFRGLLAASPTVEPVKPLQTVTPQPDGAIIHIVQPGEALLMIAEAYGIGLDDLLALNHLPKNAVIFPQQELIIRPAYTITPTVEPSHTATLLPPTSTRRPTRTPTAIQKATITPTSQPTETQTKVRAETDILGNVLLVAIAVLVIVGTALILVGMVLKRTP